MLAGALVFGLTVALIACGGSGDAERQDAASDPTPQIPVVDEAPASATESGAAAPAASADLAPATRPETTGPALAPPPTGAVEPPTPGAEAEATGSTATPHPTLPIEPLPGEPVLTGFTVPIPDACVSEFAGHQSGAPRAYRNGIHEGLDFYEFASCVPLGLGSEVIAAKDGTILRADLDYTDLTQAEYDAAEDVDFQGEEVLDLFRGRQVWIDHGAGVVTRYAHLSAIAAGIEVGDSVAAGDIIGFVGESGSPTSLHPVETDFHLHFEIRIGESYLGEGLLPLEARQLYIEAFGLDG